MVLGYDLFMAWMRSGEQSSGEQAQLEDTDRGASSNA
jgi:hypothetical protein